MKIWRNALTLKGKKVQGIFRETFILAVFSSHYSTKPCLRFLLICFVREIKGFYQSSLRNEIDFRDIMNVSPNILAVTVKPTSISYCHCKTLVPFCLQKKRPENAFLTLTVNYPKIVQKNKLWCHSIQQ